MNSLAILLGSSTRANILEGLVSASKPLSAYRLSKMYGMNVAKVYGEMKKLARTDMVSVFKGRRGLEYTLKDQNLRALASRIGPRVISFDKWRSTKARAGRFRSGLRAVPQFPVQKTRQDLLNSRGAAPKIKPTRTTGELDALALLARSKFDKKYARRGERQYARI